MERRLKKQGVENLEAYYKIVNTTEEKFIEEQARPNSIKHLERGLIMDELARAEKIQIDNEALETEFGNAWANLAMTDEEFAKRTKNGTKASREIVDAVAMESANRLLTRRVLERLKAIATGEGTEAPAAETPALEAPVAEQAPAEETPVEGEPAAAPVKKKASRKKSE
jgi:trigger factor